MRKVSAALASRPLRVALFALLLLASSAATGLADFPAETSLSSVETVEPALTDPRAAEGVAHEDLGRGEALGLLEGVFGRELAGAAGPFDELQVERFLADNVAVIPAAEQPEASGGEGEPGGEHYEDATLMDSTVPLRTESPSGREEPVELSLEPSEGTLQPSNPLVEVEVPKELGEGIELPESGVRIELPGAQQERSPSTIDKSVAFFPNVSKDADLAVALAPTGVETLTQIRGAESLHTQTFKLELPEGAVLTPTEEGGAEVTKGGETLLSVPAPGALDATGAQVPVSMEVSGDSLVLTISPLQSAQLPILLDPLFQSYKWEAKKAQTGIAGSTGYEQWSPETFAKGGIGKIPFHTANNSNGENGEYGLYVTSQLYPAFTGDHSAWIYTVPRYFTDSPKPTSFITHMTLSGLTWWANSEVLNPYLKAGLWDINKKEWVSLLSVDGYKEHGFSDTSHVYEFNNANSNKEVKVASIGLWAMENVTAYDPASVRATVATVELGESESDVPGFAPIGGPSEWINQTAAPFDFTATDTGLGVYSVTIGLDGKTSPSWKTKYGCSGVAGDACPHTWSKYTQGHPLSYEPSALPQGIDTLSFVAEDPLGHKSPVAKAQVDVDHTAPSLSISGPLSEVAAVGESWPTYRLNIEATDGTTSAPQSGVAKTTVKVDGKVVSEEAPGCATQSCASYRNWTLESSKFSTGKHTLEVSATDGVGLSTTKMRTFNLQPAPAPEIGLSGSMTQQEWLGASRPRYALDVSAMTKAPLREGVRSPWAAFSFGSAQLSLPEDAAVDSQGRVWVVSAYDATIKDFDAKGAYLGQVGKAGTSACGLHEPTDIAIDSAGKLWVSNGDGRIVKLGTAGECLLEFGKGAIASASGVAIDSKGNLWISDNASQRLDEFSPTGTLLGQFGTKGTEAGQLMGPADLAIDPRGDIWVTDSSGRVEKFDPQGKFLCQIAESGWGHGEFYGPSGLASDREGDLFVAVDNGSRIEEFNPEGEYLSEFGYYGTALGQLYRPHGIAIDAAGNFWIADTYNNRMEKWRVPPKAPVYSLAVGSKGAGEGQLSHPTAVATDGEGDLWVADTQNNRIEEFGPQGEYLSQFGKAGTAEGQLKEPYGVAVDPEGNIWVTDTGNARVEKFSPTGKYLGKLATSKPALHSPAGIAVDPEGNIWVTDAYANDVEEFSPEGQYRSLKFGTTGSGAGQLKEPFGIAADRGGHLWVTDAGNSRLEEFSNEGQYLGEYGQKGSGEGQLNRPLGVTIDREGKLWVVSAFSTAVLEYNGKGEYVNTFGGGADKGMLHEPFGIAVGTDATIWVSDSYDGQLKKWRPASKPGAFSLAAGSWGSGEGQLNDPTAIATDGLGDQWVADAYNNRIEEFGPQGEYLSQFGKAGTAEGQLKEPHGLAINPEGDIWVADTGNKRVEEFTPQGKYLGQLKQSKPLLETPIALAADPKGDIWVLDLADSRVEEFSPAGALLKSFGTKGSGPGQLNLPYGIAIDPEGKVWVADTWNNRVEDFSPTGEYLGQLGQPGSGEGEVSLPLGLAVDPEGKLWVADSGHSRVEEFNPQGTYLGRFGQASAKVELHEPLSVAVAADGRIWVSDPPMNRIQAWIPAPSGGESTGLSAEISMDGKQVYAGKAACEGGACSLDPLWTLDSSPSSAGPHAVQVSATDALGRTTTKTLAIETQPDTVKPQIESGGELVNAPDGWVEQESYSLNASAGDAGYGVTSLDFEIDGEEVASTTKACPDGGCEASLSKSIDMSEYTGGAHSAELVATDGAGNSASKHWTINVDPEGHITRTEAVGTLEAADTTSNSTIVASNSEAIDPEELAEGEEPVLTEVQGGALESSGTPDVTLIDSNPVGGFSVGVPESTIHAIPLEVADSVTSPAPVGNAAAVSADAAANVDSVVRPVYNGTMAFQSIRDVSAPTEYSWKVVMFNGETLHLVDAQHAEVDFANGVEALLISANEAHDAVGTTVPTSLSVAQGDIITLSVDHRNSNYVYPVSAGSGWEGGFTTEYVARPKNEQELREERERREREEQEARERLEAEGESEITGAIVLYANVSAPTPAPTNQPGEEADASSLGTRMLQTWAVNICAPLGICEAWENHFKGFFYFNGHESWFPKNRTPVCEPHAALNYSISMEECAWVGPNHQPYGNGYHITARTKFEVTEDLGVTSKSDYKAVVGRAFGDGRIYFHPTDQICNPSRSDC